MKYIRNMNRAKLICITGVDGAGKTTLCDNLMEKLKSKGYHVKYIYGRYRPIVYKPLFDLLKSGFSGETSEKSYEKDRESLLSKFGFRYFYEAVLLSEYLPQIYLKLFPDIFNYDYIIIDRYVYDTILKNLRYNTSDADQEISVYRRHRNLFPKIDETFFINIPAQLAYNRKEDITDISEIIRYKDKYSDFINEYGFTELDGRKTQPELIEEVLRELELEDP